MKNRMLFWVFILSFFGFIGDGSATDQLGGLSKKHGIIKPIPGKPGTIKPQGDDGATNTFIIANTPTDKPLVYGDFSQRFLKINGSLRCSTSLLINDATPWGSAPFVLGQDVWNRGIVITDKASSNKKNIYFGWNVGESHEYAEVFALQEGVGYKNLVINPNGGNMGIGTAAPQQPLHMGSGAYVSAGGVWTNASSREVKEDIKALTREEAVKALTELQPVKFRYKTDPGEGHVGFIAEDLPDLVATKDRKGMSPADVVAVLTKVVQEQQAAIMRLKQEVAYLRSISKKGGK